jgi:carbamoyl-phosphate synthase large subunit
MVELAVRIALGATLPELGWPGGLLAPPPYMSVKAPAFSTTKLRGVDPSVGPSMQSTGEVIGIHEDVRVAMAKALWGAGLVPSAMPDAQPGLAVLSIADRDKPLLPRLATALRRAGFRLAATDGTRMALRVAGFEAEPVAKLASVGAGGTPTGDAPADLVGMIRSGEARLVVNTPTPRSGPVRDAAEIRHTAIAEGVPCLTAIETAIAAAEALDPDLAAAVSEVRSLADWRQPGPGIAVHASGEELAAVR